MGKNPNKSNRGKRTGVYGSSMSMAQMTALVDQMIAKDMGVQNIPVSAARRGGKQAMFGALYGGTIIDDVEYLEHPPVPQVFTLKHKYEAALDVYQRAMAEALLLRDEDAIELLVEPIYDPDYLEPEQSWQQVNKGRKSKKERRNG